MLPLQSDGNNGILDIPQSSSITGASPSDCLESYPEHLLGESYLSAEMQSVYTTTTANWAKRHLRKTIGYKSQNNDDNQDGETRL